MEVILIISLAMNALLLVAALTQWAKASAMAQATSDLVSRIVKLEDTVRHPPEKVTIVEKKQKESL